MEAKHDPSLDNVRMIFRGLDENGEVTTVFHNPDDCIIVGTPVDDEGRDMEYVGLCRIDGDENPIPPESD